MDAAIADAEALSRAAAAATRKTSETAQAAVTGYPQVLLRYYSGGSMTLNLQAQSRPQPAVTATACPAGRRRTARRSQPRRLATIVRKYRCRPL